GHGRFPESVAVAADFLLIHFNNTALDDYTDRILPLKKYGKPIVCNEDNKVGKEGSVALAYTVENGASYGYMNIAVNQSIPFQFNGKDDDPEVYEMYKQATTPGSRMDTKSLKQPSITITQPNDGNIFMEGEPIEIKISHLF